jgi:hypothetical protein
MILGEAGLKEFLLIPLCFIIISQEAKAKTDFFPIFVYDYQ